MAGEWIKVERATPDKPEVLRISRELCIDRDAVFGKLMLIWMWFDANSHNGVVDGAVDADVDAVVRHLGFATVMRSVKWLLNAPTGIGLSLPNFDRHNGETAKTRALSNRRQAKWRNAHVDGRPVMDASTREEKRRINTTAAKSADMPSGFVEFWDSYPERGGGNPRAKAIKAYRARLAEGHTAAEILEGAKRYAGYVRASGKEGTEYVKQAATFLGPDKSFLETWAPAGATVSPLYRREGVM